MERNPEERIQSILKRKPYLQIFYGAKSGGNFQVLPDGSVTQANGKAITSRMPALEAERLLPLDRQKWTGKEIILIQGLGNPILPGLLASSLRENQICIALDHRFDLASALVRGPLLSFLERPGCHVFAGEEMLELFRTYLESIPAENFRGVRRALHGSSMREDAAFYSHVEENARSVLRSKMSDLLTRFEFEKTWLKHIVTNSRHLPPDGSGGPASILSYKDCLKGTPGMLVGAGPSLRRSRELLHAAHGKSYILACDTAAKVLLRFGIEPDGVATLDAQKHTIFHFLGADLKKVTLFADLVCNPLVFRHAEIGDVVFSTTAKYITGHDGTINREATPGTEHAEAIFGPVGDVQSGGSVATTGFEILRYLGCDPILLIGLDMAYTGGEIHSTGTHHNEKWLTKISRTSTLEGINRAVFRKRHIVMSEAVNGGQVATDYVLGLYRTWFEDSIPKSGVRVIHLNPEGALISTAERLSDPLKYLQDLSVKKIPHLGSPLQSYRHDLNSSIYRDLWERKDEPEKFFELHPFARSLLRKAEVYVSRNRAKLGEERSEGVLAKARKDAIRLLLRAWRPYFE
ncbi:MAG TPA: DUF115 domain-containing protein [Leptospiraceae bacterium]|nr:DUF115 domain-containing protein [Leptospiraceae bacterium]